MDIESQSGEAGSFSFGPVFSGSNPNTTNAYSGNSIADFLLGTPSSGSIAVNTPEARQQVLYSLFIQDDIRVSDRLTNKTVVRGGSVGERELVNTVIEVDYYGDEIRCRQYPLPSE